MHFTNQKGTATIDCGYDYMGRRFEKKVTINGVITLHHRYLYRGYLQIAALDVKRANLQDLWLLHWDPSEPIATRPLSIRKNGTWHTYGHDLTKNVMELYKTDGFLATTYDYAPFGAVSAQGDFDQPVQWSSEIYDAELALTYYNYRHYNPTDGRWINRDPIAEQGGYNLYGFVGNSPIGKLDRLGVINAGMGGIIDGTYGPVPPDSPPPSIPEKIELTYSAFCKDDKGFWDNIIESVYDTNQSITPSDFNPNSKCKKCQCIEKLTVIMHGSRWGKTNVKVEGTWGDTGLREGKNKTEISDMFKGIKFCKKCELKLLSCYLGEFDDLKKRLEQNTKCSVIVYCGKVNALFPY